MLLNKMLYQDSNTHDDFDFEEDHFEEEDERENDPQSDEGKKTPQN